MKKLFIILVSLLLILSCKPSNSFRIRFSNELGGSENSFAIGTQTDDIVCESGLLADGEVTAYLPAAAGTYSFYRDYGSGWQIALVNELPGSAAGGTEWAFETGKLYEFGTNGGVYMYLWEQ